MNNHKIRRQKLDVYVLMLFTHRQHDSCPTRTTQITPHIQDPQQLK